ncbi:MAG: S8 family serine peptidase [Verrucomicrobiia bacterium]
MKKSFILLFLAGVFSLQAGDLDTIGVTVLRQVDPTLTGSGVKVAQPEASDPGDDDFEVNPGYVGQPTNLFTYISTNGATGTGFPNSAGVESGHADNVGMHFYGIPGGVATNVSHVDNYDADYFYNHYIGNNSPLFNPTRVVNQSFAFATNDESAVDPAYDNYAAYRNTIFLSGVGNGGIYPILPPGTAYNSIGVALYFSPPLVSGPTVDGRCKPDIVAPDVADLGSEADSYAIPYVAGAAAILVQAANRRDGGANTNAASDLRTVKALLLNGAIKPVGWTNGTASPLDARYGAGLVNVFNSWEQLKGGQHAFIESTTVGSGGAHPPGANTNNEPVLAGWDYNTNSTTTATDTVKHYYFNLPGGNSFTLAATLVWNKQYEATNINNLNLFLYNAANSNLVTCSTSMVDNVEHVFLPALPAGRYDLQVLKSGSVTQISTNETYALAFEVFVPLALPLTVGLANSNAVISWPAEPTSFQLQSATSLNPPVSWTSITNAVTITNNQNVVSLPVGSGNRFFRLVGPTF